MKKMSDFTASYETRQVVIAHTFAPMIQIYV